MYSLKKKRVTKSNILSVIYCMLCLPVRKHSCLRIYMKKFENLIFSYQYFITTLCHKTQIRQTYKDLLEEKSISNIRKGKPARYSGLIQNIASDQISGKTFTLHSICLCLKNKITMNYHITLLDQILFKYFRSEKHFFSKIKSVFA